MAYKAAQYVDRSEQLLAAAQQFRAALANPKIDPDFAVEELLGASAGNFGQEVVSRFEAPTASGLPPSRPEDALSAALLDIQTANLLVSAGIAVSERGASADTGPLDASITQLHASVASATGGADARLAGFAPPSPFSSTNRDEAAHSFTDASQTVLQEITQGSWDVASAVLKSLAKLVPGDVAEALGKLGDGVTFGTTVDRLIRRGFEKLKSAINAVVALFGSDTLRGMKDAVHDLWDKFKPDQFGPEILSHFLFVPSAEVEIQKILSQQALETTAIDRASNELAPLSQQYGQREKLLSGIATGVGFVAGLYATFHAILPPWIPVAIAGIYLVVLAAAVALGMAYTGEKLSLSWVTGVVQVARRIPAA